mgnify:CR=1 FL=1
MSPLLKIFIAIVLILILLGLPLYFDADIEVWASNNQNFLQAFNVLSNFLIGIALFYVGWEANEISKTNHIKNKQSRKEYRRLLNLDERAIFKENYDKVSKALSLVIRDGDVNEQAMALFWQARDEARLELPEEIATYTEKLRATAQKAWANNRFAYDRNGQPKNIEISTWRCLLNW